MAKKLNSKKSNKSKIIVASILAAVILVAALVSVVMVLAAGIQNVQSYVNVSYTVEDVAAKVSATYAAVPTAESETITKVAMTGGTNGELTFNAGDANDASVARTLTADAITLSSTTKRVVFEYKFKNIAESAINITLAETPQPDNMNVWYYVSESEVNVSAYRNNYIQTTLGVQSLEAKNEEVYVYIIVEIRDLNTQASYSGDIEWVMMLKQDPYIIENTASGTKITSQTNENIYVLLEAGSTFTYGNANYTTTGEYIMLTPEQNVTLTGTASHAGGVSVQTTKPSDLATKKFFATYGEYPQTYVGNTLNETLKNATLTATGKTYTTDIDGSDETLVEYLYNGVKYAKLTNSYPVDWNTLYFSTGDEVVSEETYFFYVEPIVVKAMEVSDNSAIVMSVKILGSMAFDDEGDFENWDESTFDNSWKNSDLREYLNGTFLTDSGLSDIAQPISIKNEDLYDTSNHDDNTTDKIWLPSAEEIIEWTGTDWDSNKQQFIYDWYLRDENDVSRKRPLTDLAKATYAYESDGNGCYFLRSAGYNDCDVCSVVTDGCVYTSNVYNYADYGFPPAFSINL